MTLKKRISTYSRKTTQKNVDFLCKQNWSQLALSATPVHTSCSSSTPPATYLTTMLCLNHKTGRFYEINNRPRYSDKSTTSCRLGLMTQLSDQARNRNQNIKHHLESETGNICPEVPIAHMTAPELVNIAVLEGNSGLNAIPPYLTHYVRDVLTEFTRTHTTRNSIRTS